MDDSNDLPNSAVSPKILPLFEQRGVLSMARRALSPEAFSEWLGKVLLVQNAIYDLDTYYERTNGLVQSVEQPMWNKLDAIMQTGPGAFNATAWHARTELGLYGATEARIHEFDLIDAREYSKIAQLKCSDVRIARALIWSYSQDMAYDDRLFRYWSLYDQCRELAEDALDMHEDGKDWNFNFWLYGARIGQSLAESVAAAAETLRLKLSGLEDAYRELPLKRKHEVSVSFRDTLRLGKSIISIPMRRILSTADLIRYDEEIIPLVKVS